MSPAAPGTPSPGPGSARARVRWERLRQHWATGNDEQARAAWHDRRIRLALRRMGPLKDQAVQREFHRRTTTSVDTDSHRSGESDCVDGLFPRSAIYEACILNTKQSLGQLSKHILQELRNKKKKREWRATTTTARDLPDFSSETKREFGVGRLGDLLHWEHDLNVSRRPHVKYQLDDMSDYRPYFSYWVSFVQTIILFVALAAYGVAPFGAGLYKGSGLVLTERLALEEVSVRMPHNFWVGPTVADLVHLGAKYTPCMRKDHTIHREIEDQRTFEAKYTGCCIRNDRSGCLQTTSDGCSRFLSHFEKWMSSKPGPYGRTSGPVCGLDPYYCLKGGASVWHDNISKWPLCHQAHSMDPMAGDPDHMTCEVLARPCCIGIHGKCELHSREFCDFVQGTFHPKASLCSQVSCMKDVCGMLPFATGQDSPDQMYRLWTSLFLCAGIIHLGIVVIFQIYLMSDLEKMCGWWRLAIIYIGSGIVGNAASAVFVPYRPETGPSGAIFGIMASFLMEVVKAWDILRRPKVAISQLLLVMTFFVLTGFLPWVDNYAHVFGFGTGLLLSNALLPSVEVYSQESTDFRSNRNKVAIWACFVSALLLLITLLVVFYSQTEECEICKWLSCIPFTADFCAEQNIDFKTKPAIF